MKNRSDEGKPIATLQTFLHNFFPPLKATQQKIQSEDKRYVYVCVCILEIEYTTHVCTKKVVRLFSKHVLPLAKPEADELRSHGDRELETVRPRPQPQNARWWWSLHFSRGMFGKRLSRRRCGCFFGR